MQSKYVVLLVLEGVNILMRTSKNKGKGKRGNPLGEIEVDLSKEDVSKAPMKHKPGNPLV